MIWICFSFTLKQQLQTARQELSHALYQHDAACRVIARLTKEVSAAREALATLKPQQQIAPPTPGGTQAVPAESTSQAMEVVGINQEIHQKLQDTAGALTQERKRKAKSVPATLTSSDDIKGFTVTASHTGLHSASSPGIMCLDICKDLIVTGGNDKAVTVFNKSTEQIVASLKGHTKKVMQVCCHPYDQIVMSGSMDNTARVWHIPTSQCIQVIRAHESTITGLSLHATGDYLLLSSMDQYWSFVDLRTGAIYAKVLGDEEQALTSAKFHPDGLIFATGTLSADVKIWDLKDQQNVATFTGHQGPVTGIAFSENGYYLATAAEDCSVKLWDLRKLKNFKTIQMDEGFNITDVTFDFSGSYLGLAGNDVRIYGCKSWNEIQVFNDHTAMATGIRFGSDAEWLTSTSMDRTVKIYSGSK